MNFVHVAGHLAADPEVRFTTTGKKVTTLRVGARSRKGGTDVTIWWRVTIWGDQFDKMIPHLKKGSAVICYGDLQKPEIYTDREGKSQISLEMWASNIQFSPFGKTERDGTTTPSKDAAPTTQGPVNPYMSQPMQSMPSGETFDDEVPF